MNTIERVKAKIEERIILQSSILRRVEKTDFVEGSIDALQGILDFINFIKDKPKTDEEPATPFDTIRLFTDVNLVQELRRRGYEVTAEKTIKL